MDESATVAPPNAKSWQFKPGNSEYRPKKQRIAALAERLANDYDARSATAKQLLGIAAQHLDQAATTRNNAIRARATVRTTSNRMPSGC
jgi:hypothetical protein